MKLYDYFRSACGNKNSLEGEFNTDFSDISNLRVNESIFKNILIRFRTTKNQKRVLIELYRNLSLDTHCNLVEYKITIVPQCNSTYDQVKAFISIKNRKAKIADFI